MCVPVLARGMGATGPHAQVCWEGLSAKPAPGLRVPLICRSQLDRQRKPIFQRLLGMQMGACDHVNQHAASLQLLVTM